MCGTCDSGEPEHEERVAPAPLPDLPRKAAVVHPATSCDSDILNAVYAVAHGVPPGSRVEDLLPENLTGIGIEGPETAGVVGDEHQPAAGGPH